MTYTFVVIDDHAAVLGGTVAALKVQYPNAQIITASTGQEAEEQVAGTQPDVVVMDLSIPSIIGNTAQTETGISLLRTLMTTYPSLNIVVQSAHVRSLVRIKLLIDRHEGGLTIADKSLSSAEMLKRVDWALQGLMCTPRDMRMGLEVKPEWIQVLTLAFHHGLQDKTIAEAMNISERTVRHYWTKVQDALGVYPAPGKNIRIQTELSAREQGLID